MKSTSVPYSRNSMRARNARSRGASIDPISGNPVSVVTHGGFGHLTQADPIPWSPAPGDSVPEPKIIPEATGVVHSPASVQVRTADANIHSLYNMPVRGMRSIKRRG
jgi:hypothetical protein